MNEYPDDCRYTKEHEWVKKDGTIGVTHYAQKQLGDVVYLELPEEGRALAVHEVFGTVESVKAVSELFAPIAGEVAAANEALVKAPETLNSDPYGQGWMIKMKPADPAAIDALMDADAYRAYVESESK